MSAGVAAAFITCVCQLGWWLVGFCFVRVLQVYAQADGVRGTEMCSWCTAVFLKPFSMEEPPEYLFISQQTPPCENLKKK